MTVREKFIESGYFDKLKLSTANEIIELVEEYTRLKCLEAIKNTRYAAIEIIQNNFIDREENVILLSIARDVHNIRNENVMPKL